MTFCHIGSLPALSADKYYFTHILAELSTHLSISLSIKGEGCLKGKYIIVVILRFAYSLKIDYIYHGDSNLVIKRQLRHVGTA